MPVRQLESGVLTLESPKPYRYGDIQVGDLITIGGFGGTFRVTSLADHTIGLSEALAT